MTPILGLAASLFVAFCQSATDIGTKAATRDAEERLILAVEWIVGAVALTMVCLFVHPEFFSRPVDAWRAMTTPDFPWIVAAGAALNAIAYFLFVRALRLSDASLVAPLVLATPALLLVTSPIMVGEQVSPLGGLGVVLSVLGAVILATSEPGATRRLSLIAFVKDRGVHSMFATAAIWSITANLDKMGVKAATPMIWIAALSVVMAIMATLAYVLMPRRPFRLSDLRWAFFAGGALAIGNAVQMFALTALFVPYVIAIKRMSALFTVLAGGLLFGESIRSRMLGAAIMLAGAAVMALAHK